MKVKKPFTILATALAFSAGAEAKDFVLTAKGQFGQAQASAVTNAGGSVYYSHEGTGLVMARSDAPNFRSAVMASGAFSQALEDMLVQWTPEVNPVPVENVIDPTNDTFFPVQWAPGAISAPDAWAAGCTGDGVRVAVLDGGIHSTHADLAANLDVAASTSFVPGQPFNADTGTFWHGTHVAGIVAAADNTTGVVGIAPEATIVGVKVLHSGTGSFGGVIAGILYAATPLSQGGGGADIINMSLGARFAKNEPGAGPLVAAMNKAVNFANRFGVLVVSSAGNDEADLDHDRNFINVPAQSGAGIAIAATGPVGWATGMGDDANNFSRLASYSNFGHSAVHVSAPGGDFVLPGEDPCTVGPVVGFPCWVFDMVLSTSRGTTAAGSYSWAAGTSMAAPAASAVAAIIKQQNPGISLGALKTKLAQTADDINKPGADPESGKGWVNAARACGLQ
jgi:subtilisin family serine protease